MVASDRSMARTVPSNSALRARAAVWSMITPSIQVSSSCSLKTPRPVSDTQRVLPSRCSRR